MVHVCVGVYMCMCVHVWCVWVCVCVCCALRVHCLCTHPAAAQASQRAVTPPAALLLGFVSGWLGGQGQGGGSSQPTVGLGSWAVQTWTATNMGTDVAEGLFSWQGQVGVCMVGRGSYP